MFSSLLKQPVAAIVFSLALSVTGCATHTTLVDNSAGRKTIHEDPGSSGALEGVGFSSQDVRSMCDRMVRDILANPFWQETHDQSGTVIPPRIVVDDRCFRNRGFEKINKVLITDHFRTGLIRAAKGRLTFLARHLIHVVEHERDLKRHQVVSSGTKRPAPRPLGADYRLCGSLTTQDKASADQTMISRYTQVAMEIVDVNDSKLVWSSLYSFRKVMPASLAAPTQSQTSQPAPRQAPSAPAPVQTSVSQAIVSASGGPKKPTPDLRADHELNVRVWSDKAAYRVGDQLRLHFMSNRDCFLYLFYQSNSGEVALIFPKAFGEHNRVEAAREYTIPDPNYGVDFIFQPPTGTDKIKAMATTDPYEAKSWQSWGLEVLQDKIKRHRPVIRIKVVP